MDVLPLLDRAFSEAIEVAAKTSPDDLGRPTPCSEWDVQALVNHFLGSATRLSTTAAGKPGLEPGADLVEGNPAQSVAARLEAALELWRQPGIMEATCSLPIGEVPGLVAANISLVDIYTHRWDLARAVGGDTELNDEVAEAALAFSQAFIGDEVRGKVGFAPPIELGPNASPGDRLVAFLGRQP
jgi:uncharacterized protein (TIGR03086 family)